MIWKPFLMVAHFRVFRGGGGGGNLNNFYKPGVGGPFGTLFFNVVPFPFMNVFE